MIINSRSQQAPVQNRTTLRFVVVPVIGSQQLLLLLRFLLPVLLVSAECYNYYIYSLLYSLLVDDDNEVFSDDELFDIIIIMFQLKYHTYSLAHNNPVMTHKIFSRVFIFLLEKKTIPQTIILITLCSLYYKTLILQISPFNIWHTLSLSVSVLN